MAAVAAVAATAAYIRRLRAELAAAKRDKDEFVAAAPGGTRIPWQRSPCCRISRRSGVRHRRSRRGLRAFFEVDPRVIQDRVACVEVHVAESRSSDSSRGCARRCTRAIQLARLWLAAQSCAMHRHMHPCHRLGRLSARSIAKNRSMWFNTRFSSIVTRPNSCLLLVARATGARL